MPTNLWLKTTDIYYLRVLEFRRLKTSHQQSHFPSGDHRRKPIPCFFKLLVAVRVPEHRDTSLSASFHIASLLDVQQ